MKIRITNLVGALIAVTATRMLFADTYTVTNTNDTLTAGTLRQAITDANAHANSLNPGSVPDRIHFSIPGNGPHTIAPGSALPTITDPVVIDGYTQGDSTSGTTADDALENTNATGGLNTVLKIELNGTNAGNSNGLVITAGSSTVRGLAINRFAAGGIDLETSDGNVIEGCFVGTNISGTAVLQNGFSGIFVRTANNLIGGTTPAARNLSSGNGFHGVEISGSAATGNQVQGNLLGTNAAGTASLTGAESSGVLVDGANNNVIGGTASGAGNVLSGNVDFGIFLVNTSSGNRIEGNYVGTDANGTAALGNNRGIVFIDNSTNNTIGGAAAGARNIISGNNQRGVYLFGNGTSGNMVYGNFIGTDVTGALDLGNGEDGVRVNGSPNNKIGGTGGGEGNVISGNEGDGIWIFGSGATGNLVQGNYIGTDVTGTLDLGNTFVGARIQDVPSNTIGGTAAGARNIISGNDENGVSIIGSLATMNVVHGNFIGTDVNGTADLGNTEQGVVIYNAPNNKIGGGNTGEGNVISGNDDNGVFISGATAQSNQISQNLIGRNAANTGALGNTGHGVFLMSSGPNTIGGGFNPSNANTIAHNGGDGVAVVFGAGPCIKKGIISNSIFSNGGLGIDLENDGVTPNDVGDGDTGANTLQNFPVLTSGSTGGGNTTINGSLNSTASTSFHIEFFASAAADPTEYGEGQTFLGFEDVTTDSSGNVTFTAVLPVLPPAGQTIISATTTDNAELANTSEFSKVVQIAGTAGDLLNISTRGRVLTGDNVLIGGFIVTGSDSKKVIIRAIGPSLANANPSVPDALANPTLSLHDGNGALIVSNDDWKINDQTQQSQEAEVNATGLAPTNDFESAIVRTLSPGAYTGIVTGKNNTTGVGLAEIYDLDQAANSILANISTRGFVDTGDNVLIGGVIVGGGGGGSAQVIVRAIGPSLSSFGISNPLQDPILELHDHNGALLVSNDNWKSTQQTEIEATGLAPTNDAESAVVFFAPPGSFTVVVRGQGNTTGVGLVEVYKL